MSESSFIKWKKPSGKIMSTNKDPATIAAAMKLGWKRHAVKAESKAEPKAE